MPQHRHEFLDALADLDRAIERDRNHPQAWLTRAIVLQVLGHYAEAQRSCREVLQLSGALVGTTCIASTGSLHGAAEKSYEVLLRTVAAHPVAPPDAVRWALTVLAETAARLGNTEQAERHFRQALAVRGRDRAAVDARAHRGVTKLDVAFCRPARGPALNRAIRLPKTCFSGA